MKRELKDKTKKWPAMVSAVDTVVAQNQDGINFGMMLFPGNRSCGVGRVESGIAPNNKEAISTALDNANPDGYTPTHTTLADALAYYNSIPVNPNGRYVLLATDGQPNCVNPDDLEEVRTQESIDAIAALKQAEINTYVLGFGSDVNNDPTTLQQMAVAGGTGTYYAANSSTDLEAALAVIASSVSLPPCTLELVDTPEDDSRLEVYFDDDAVERDPDKQNGWEYDQNDNAITIYGASCDELRSGSVSEIAVDYGCGGEPVIVK
ncbi:MAG: VWA domain-containing protein [Proteobacteria bacterium]|nr:VWA domain-containing protein [Pseudomonadota bacterium]